MNKSELSRHKRLKELIINVNNTLSYFELGYISVRRFSDPSSNYMDGNNTATSFKDYIEARFNYECSKIPELNQLEIMTEGNLFKIIKLEGVDEDRKRFKEVTFTILTPDMIVEPSEDLINEIEKARIFLFGESKRGILTFNDVKNRVYIKVQ